MNFNKSLKNFDVCRTYTSDFKCEGGGGAPWAAIADAGAGTLASVLGYITTNRTNNTNWEIAQATNQANERINQRNLDWQERMWNLNNEYNTPSAQRQRFEEAGFNPFLMLNKTDSGSASAASAPSSLPAVTGAPMQAYDFGSAGERLGNSISRFFVNDGLHLDNEMKRVDLAYKVTEKAAELQDKINSGKVKGAEYERAKAELDYFTRNVPLLLRQSEASANLLEQQSVKESYNIALADAQQKGQMLVNEYQRLVNQSFDKRLSADLAQAYADVSAKRAAGQLSTNMAVTEVTNYQLKRMQAKGVRIDNKIKTELFKLNKKSIQLEQRQQGADYWNPFKYVGSSGSSALNVLSRFIK